MYTINKRFLENRYGHKQPPRRRMSKSKLRLYAHIPS
nr:MAG TPA: hypothetical protein [Caudoviricetes sp.]